MQNNEIDEFRTLHVNPYGNVMPFGGPWRSNSQRQGSVTTPWPTRPGPGSNFFVYKGGKT